MPHVKIVKPFATSDENRIQGAMLGDVVQVSDDDAAKWIADGLVEPVGTPSKPREKPDRPMGKENADKAEKPKKGK